MATQQLADLDFVSVSRILNLTDAVSPQQPATFAQLNAAIEGLKSKNPAKVLTSANVNLASPGATLDGQAMAVSDRFVANGQTTNTENGIYVWNGAASPATRALDANTATELTNAVISIQSGTSAGITFRQVNTIVTLGSDPVAFSSFGTTAPPASETVAGIAEIATQVETDTGTDDQRIVTPLKLKNWVGRKQKFIQNIGDGTATQYDVTHNFNSRDVQVTVYRNATPWDNIGCDISRPTVNSVRMNFAAAPTANQFTVMVLF